jgi:hypothetical protein
MGLSLSTVDAVDGWAGWVPGMGYLMAACVDIAYIDIVMVVGGREWL